MLLLIQISIFFKPIKKSFNTSMLLLIYYTQKKSKKSTAFQYIHVTINPAPLRLLPDNLPRFNTSMLLLIPPE